MNSKLAALVVGETDRAAVQLFRYALVGGLAFVVDFSTLFVLKEYAGLSYLWAAAVSFLFGLSTNYALSVTWVFDKRAVKNRHVEFVIFALLGVLGLGLNELTMFLFTSILGLHYLVSKLVSTAITFAWNYLSRKVLLFSFAASESEDEIEPLPVHLVETVAAQTVE